MSELAERQRLDIDHLNDRAYRIRISDPAQARELADQAHAMSEVLGYQRGIGCALRTRAATLVRFSSAEGMVLATEAISILLAEGDEYNASSAYLSISCYLLALGNDDASLEAIHKGIELAKASGNTYVLAAGKHNLGSHFEKLGDLSRAVFEYEDSIRMAELGENPDVKFLSMGHRIRCLSKLDRDRIDPEQIESAIFFATESGITSWIGYALVAKAIYYAYGEDRRLAIETRRAARQFCARENCIQNFVHLLEEYANALNSQGKTEKYSRTLRSLINVAEQQNWGMLEVRFLPILAEIELSAGDYESAAHRYKHYIELRDSIQFEQGEARLRELNILHNTSRYQTAAKVAMDRSEQLEKANHELRVAIDVQSQLQHELMRLASTDDLTGALNRRQLINDGILEMERYRHMGEPFSVTILDIDHFKSINDTFGHATGDEVLRRITKCAQSLLRRFDVFGRLGGEEFCIIHHDTDVAGATKAVERLMKAMGRLFTEDILPDRELTISVGIAEVRPDDNNFFDTLHNADLALYQAKRGGRNTYRVASSWTIEAA